MEIAHLYVNSVPLWDVTIEISGTRNSGRYTPLIPAPVESQGKSPPPHTQTPPPPRQSFPCLNEIPEKKVLWEWEVFWHRRRRNSKMRNRTNISFLIFRFSGFRRPHLRGWDFWDTERGGGCVSHAPWTPATGYIGLVNSSYWLYWSGELQLLVILVWWTTATGYIGLVNSSSKWTVNFSFWIYTGLVHYSL